MYCLGKHLLVALGGLGGGRVGELFPLRFLLPWKRKSPAGEADGVGTGYRFPRVTSDGRRGTRLSGGAVGKGSTPV